VIPCWAAESETDPPQSSLSMAQLFQWWTLTLVSYMRNARQHLRER
jgi:hypothetical protein